MALIWTLKKVMVMRKDIYRASDLQAALASQSGMHLSLQAVSSLLKKQPEVLRLSTMQAICNTLNCNLSDFCEVGPDVLVTGIASHSASPTPSNGGQDKFNGSLFPNPFEFTTEIRD